VAVEAFRQGARGVAAGRMLEALPWGFALQDIKMPDAPWHGENDVVQLLCKPLTVLLDES
jgi:hypothetical protein